MEPGGEAPGMLCSVNRKTDFNTQSGKRSAKRSIALAVCVFFIAASILSAAFVLTHAGHTHDHNGTGGSCAACVHIAAAENLLKSISAALAGAAIIYGGLSAALSVLKPGSFFTDFYTLVHLKIRSNN